MVLTNLTAGRTSRVSDERGLCAQCGLPWHPPVFCWAYQWLDAETIEKIIADVMNRGFEEWATERAVQAWESDGGRIA